MIIQMCRVGPLFFSPKQMMKVIHSPVSKVDAPSPSFPPPLDPSHNPWSFLYMDDEFNE